MSLIKDFIGIILIFVAFFNPFNLDFIFRLILFILAFDLLSFLPKIAIFIFDFLFGFTGLGVLLIFLFFADVLSKIISASLSMILKPLIVFGLIYLVNPDLGLSLFSSMVNFLINSFSYFKLARVA